MHVRANPGQDFLVEWASGHPGSYHYLVVLKATDEAKMTTHSEAMLNAYLNAAPAAALLQGAKYQKMHYGWTCAPPPPPSRDTRTRHRRPLAAQCAHE